MSANCTASPLAPVAYAFSEGYCCLYNFMSQIGGSHYASHLMIWDIQRQTRSGDANAHWSTTVETCINKAGLVM